jgi:hypothetical protein
MTLPTPLPAILEALRNAGATEEIIAAAGRHRWEIANSPPEPQNGRPRTHADGESVRRT